MTLQRFLLWLAIGVVLALFTQWVWLYWVLGAVTLVVVIQLVRT